MVTTEKNQQWKDAQNPQAYAQPRPESTPKAPIAPAAPAAPAANAAQKPDAGMLAGAPRPAQSIAAAATTGPGAQISPRNIFPQAHPSAGNSIYAAAGKELGSSGTFATVPPEMSHRGNSIAAAARNSVAAPAPAPTLSIADAARNFVAAPTPTATPSIAALAMKPNDGPPMPPATQREANALRMSAEREQTRMQRAEMNANYDAGAATMMAEGRAAATQRLQNAALRPNRDSPAANVPVAAGAGAGAAESIAQAASTKPWDMNALAGKLGGMDNEMRYQSQVNGMPAAGAGPVSIAAARQTTNNVTRVGNSYSGTNVAGDITVNGQEAGGGFSVIPKAGMVGGGGAQSQGAVNMSLAAAASRGDWNAVRSHYANRGQNFGGQTPEQIKASIPQGPQTSVMRVGAFGFDPQAREARMQQQSIAAAAMNPNFTRSQRAAAIDLQRQQAQSADNAARIGADERRNDASNQTSIANAVMRERGDDRRAADSNALRQRELSITEQNAQITQRDALRKQAAMQEYGEADTDEKRAAIKRRYPDVFPQDQERPASDRYMKIRTDQVINSRGEQSGGGDRIYDTRTGQLINPAAGVAP